MDLEIESSDENPPLFCAERCRGAADGWAGQSKWLALIGLWQAVVARGGDVAVAAQLRGGRLQVLQCGMGGPTEARRRSFEPARLVVTGTGGRRRKNVVKLSSNLTEAVMNMIR